VRGQPSLFIFTEQGKSSPRKKETGTLPLIFLKDKLPG